MLRLAGVASLATFCLAQFPAEPTDATVVNSRFRNVSISYKETTICETTPGVKGYAGHVHLPPDTLQDLDFNQSYPINSFFWYFESRKDPVNAPLVIWINGGPGSSSMLGLLAENGPCTVNSDSNSTTLNPWSWNNEANVLYLDQPVGVGFSFDTRRNITQDIVSGNATFLNATDPIPQQNSTFLVGTWSSLDNTTTSFGSTAAAGAAWHFLQTWTQEFPHYKPKNKGISLAAESYGGRYGPEFFSFFERQNERIRNGSFESVGADQILELDTLILISGCVDPIMYYSFPELVWNNTYGLQLVNETVRDQMLDDLYKKDGCIEKYWKCGNASLLYDPEGRGMNATVNQICGEAGHFCDKALQRPYLDTGRNVYDITASHLEANGPQFFTGYLSQPHVQQALGVPLNWTRHSSAVRSAFGTIGDFRPGHLNKLAYLLDRGINVHLSHGDRDYVCNWLAGESFSLNIPSTFNSSFHSSGYTPIQTNKSHIGGQVRQTGNFSFSLVYDAGHMIPAYQPETAYQIFLRAIQHRDIATGEERITDEYVTTGRQSLRDLRREVPRHEKQVCYTLNAHNTCTKEQLDGLGNGTVVVKDWILVDKNSTELYPEIFGDGGGGDEEEEEETSSGEMHQGHVKGLYGGNGRLFSAYW
ncbi:hypothetical protein CBER1_04600 [Cercospora berteroae]|uniref:Carboxypeptidase n=1 Tax=Cercospora berteroae TaxID=357750 RepID=A0A2S6C2F1_9PEZI|nr:hypothetical protein CBER1_04600 [Cercospora berteroae]